MTPSFIHADFLLQNEAAQRLYHEHAADLPIIDYHNHLPPEELAADRQFENMTRIWLAGDHYKWRAMRAQGIDEARITGSASDEDKFMAWAETVPACLRNPLYHWTHLELSRPFGIRDRLFGPDTAAGIWEECNAALQRPEFSCRGILEQMKVEVLCTTDDPTDDLAHHRSLRQAADPALQVLPTFRPDKAMDVAAPARFNAWCDQLVAAAEQEIGSWTAFLDALEARHTAFHELGCRLSDHGLEVLDAAPATETQLATAFSRLRGGEELDALSQAQLRSALMLHFGRLGHSRGWVQQLHLGAQRNNNRRMFAQLGPDTGFDSMGDLPQAKNLAWFLDELDATDQLPKTILYNNNPVHNAVFATMCGNYQGGGVRGKMQFGAAWWHLDQWDGMRRQMEDLGNMGLLSRFVGMLTDSRSFLSFTRHEYFRRLLCQWLGEDIERGFLPRDFDLVGGMVRDICYHNAKNWFAFHTSQP